MVVFLGCACMLQTPVQLFIHQYSQILLCRVALNPFIPQPVLIPKIALSQVLDIAFGLVKPHEAHIGPLVLSPSGWHPVLQLCQLCHSAWCLQFCDMRERERQV